MVKWTSIIEMDFFVFLLDMQLEVFKDAFSCWENGEEKKMRTRTIFFPVVVADNRNKLHACFFVEMRIPASCGEEKKIESWRKTCLETRFLVFKNTS